jgi:hypothetical protein
MDFLRFDDAHCERACDVPLDAETGRGAHAAERVN